MHSMQYHSNIASLHYKKPSCFFFVTEMIQSFVENCFTNVLVLQVLFRG